MRVRRNDVVKVGGDLDFIVFKIAQPGPVVVNRVSDGRQNLVRVRGKQPLNRVVGKRTPRAEGGCVSFAVATRAVLGADALFASCTHASRIYARVDSSRGGLWQQ